jgi:hypothetical protein
MGADGNYRQNREEIMRTSATALASAFAAVSIFIAMFPTVGFSAQMTREQARTACRNEVPKMPRGDKGNSRGFNQPNTALRDCIKAKMAGH